MKRLLLLLLCCFAAFGAQAAAEAPKKVLRYAFLIAETGFDPAQVSDLYSRIITAHIFEAPYTYDHLARPAKIKPLTAAAMPEVSSDFRTWTIKLKPGIYFDDDPAFGGKRRELVAQDYVYSLMRTADPTVKSSSWPEIEEQGFLGLGELREQVLKTGKPFPYDHPIEGLKALDRYTLQLKTREPRPRLVQLLAESDLYGAVAREVIEAYPGHSMEHPVGTGPFKLVQWRRSSFIALERNPNFRESYYDAEPAPDDAEGQTLLAHFKGRRLPMLDRVEISIIEESQPRWLSFLNGQFDFMYSLPLEFVNLAVPGGKIAPNLAKKGIKAYRAIAPDMTLAYFNMEDPMVGGYTPEKVALRRAVSLAYDTGREIRLIRRGQAIPAQGPLAPHTYGYDPNFKSENGDYDPARAKALLDLFGYVDRDGDGWRDNPDGSPLQLRMATEPDQTSRQFDELWKRCMTDVGIRIAFEPAKWPENLKSARAGKLMMWRLGSTADVIDGQSALARWYGPQAGAQNLARFRRPEFDRIYAQLKLMPNGPERLALFDQAKRLAVAWMPYKVNTHRILTDLAYPQLVGYRRPVVWLEWWHMVDIEPDKAPKPH